MIRVTRLDGSKMMLNADWIQTLETTPDTLITLTSGLKFHVKDKIEDVVAAFKEYKQEITAPKIQRPSKDS